MDAIVTNPPWEVRVGKDADLEKVCVHACVYISTEWTFHFYRMVQISTKWTQYV
jgi:hypothetical protein